MGLDPHRDRLCLVQLSAGDGVSHLVQFAAGSFHAPRLEALLADPSTLKIFHFARFDVAVLQHYLGVLPRPIYCTKIASRLVRTSRSSSNPRIGVLPSSPTSSCAMPRRTCSTSTRSKRSSMRCWRARGAKCWRRPASISCRRGRSSISAAGASRTSSRTDAPGSAVSLTFRDVSSYLAACRRGVAAFPRPPRRFAAVGEPMPPEDRDWLLTRSS